MLKGIDCKIWAIANVIIRILLCCVFDALMLNPKLFPLEICWVGLAAFVITELGLFTSIILCFIKTFDYNSSSRISGRVLSCITFVVNLMIAFYLSMNAILQGLFLLSSY